MIHEKDQELADWAKSVVGDVPTLFEIPKELTQGSGVLFCLVSLLPAPPPSTGKIAPLQYKLRYLVTTWAESTLEAHRLLGDLVFAAMENSKFEIDLNPVPFEFWQACGWTPQPSFGLTLLVQKPRPEPAVKYVKKVVIDSLPAVILYGLVHGPEDIPIAGARIELRDPPLSTYTDNAGRFRFDNVPAGMPAKLNVKAKGRVFEVIVKEQTSTEKPLVIPITLE